MKNYKIAIQNGLNDIENALKTEGYDVVPYLEAGLQADICIISGVDSEYEEIETAQCRLRGSGEDDQMLLINASGLSPEQVVKYVKNNRCSV